VVCAIHPEVGLSSLHFDEVPVKQAMLASASHVIAVTTADKLGQWSPLWLRLVPVCRR
jgi:DeoR/GlpR family transcriptional regulator of sugar metabolism